MGAWAWEQGSMGAWGVEHGSTGRGAWEHGEGSMGAWGGEHGSMGRVTVAWCVAAPAPIATVAVLPSVKGHGFTAITAPFGRRPIGDGDGEGGGGEGGGEGGGDDGGGGDGGEMVEAARAVVLRVKVVVVVARRDARRHGAFGRRPIGDGDGKASHQPARRRAPSARLSSLCTWTRLSTSETKITLHLCGAQAPALVEDGDRHSADTENS